MDVQRRNLTRPTKFIYMHALFIVLRSMEILTCKIIFYFFIFSNKLTFFIFSFCQWGGGNTLCDNLPRKRFSLMTHILDRHCTNDALKLSTQKRVRHDLLRYFKIYLTKIFFKVTASESGQAPQPQGQKQPYPVTLYRQPNPNASQDAAGGSQSAGMAAMQAIKRHSVDFVHLKDVAVRICHIKCCLMIYNRFYL